MTGSVSPAGGGDSAAAYLPWWEGGIRADAPTCASCSWTVRSDPLGGPRWALKLRHRRCPQHGDGLAALAAGPPDELDGGGDE